MSVITAGHIEGSLADRRWFGGGGKQISSIDVVDQVEVTEDAPVLLLAIARVGFADGDVHLYHLPLLRYDDGSVRDAFDDMEHLRVVGPLMSHGESFAGQHGTFHFGGPGLDPLHPPGQASIRPVGAEQTNTSLVLDEAIVVKVFRRVQIGPNPDLEITRFLTNEGFVHIPAHVGEIIYDGRIGEEEIPVDLGIAQTYLAESEEGWRYVLRELHHLYDRIEPSDDVEDARFLIEDRASVLLGRLEELGDVTASLHVALTRDEGMDPYFTPEEMNPSELKELAESVRVAIDRLGGDFPELRGPLRAKIEPLLDRVGALSDVGLRTRVHNDYHLGQVLLSGKGWMILDFEGEPARTLEERRAKQSPLKDAAGMLRSFSYAATTALLERAEPGSGEWRLLQPWADAWERLARERFLSSYVTGAHTEGRFLPEERDELDAMLALYEIDKAVYELGYEKAHRPEWTRIPLRGIARLAEGV